MKLIKVEMAGVSVNILIIEQKASGKLYLAPLFFLAPCPMLHAPCQLFCF
jgi:hypothetical protein